MASPSLEISGFGDALLKEKNINLISVFLWFETISSPILNEKQNVVKQTNIELEGNILNFLFAYNKNWCKNYIFGGVYKMLDNHKVISFC